MPTAISLAQMVDLAIGSPEVGAVNFSVMHALLHAVLKQLNIDNAKAEISEEDEKDLLQNGDRLGKDRKNDDSKRELSSDQMSDADSGVTNLTSGTKPESAGHEKTIQISRMPYHQLEKKVERLERQWTELNSLPTNEELIEKVKGEMAGSEVEKKRPVVDMWQSMQLTRKVDANTQGVSKLMSLVEDMMMEIQNLKDKNDELKKRLDESATDSNKLEDILNKLLNLENLTKDFDKKMQDLNERIPDSEMMNGFVTWSALEDTLRGLRDQLNEVQTHPTEQSNTENVPNERIVVEVGNQTDAKSKNRLSRPTSQYNKSRASTPGPSPMLQELLERLGTLNDRHEHLEERVNGIEMELNNKASKDDLNGLVDVITSKEESLTPQQPSPSPQQQMPSSPFQQMPPLPPQQMVSSGSHDGIPEDFAELVRKLSSDLEAMKGSRLTDIDILSQIQKSISDLKSDLERLSQLSQQLYEESENQKNRIENLTTTCGDLENNKADKEFVQSEVDVKADKDHLETKVNCTEFDKSCEDINRMINDILAKLLGNEGEWKKVFEQLTNDVDGKLDRLEFGPFRDELEKQLRALAKKMNSLQATGGAMSEDEAAGLRKQLLQKFHCISCDKPVAMMPQKPIPSLPSVPGMPEHRSMRPYTVYELDQIRNHARSMLQPPQHIDMVDLYATDRACGGSHTLTFPHRRITKLTRTNQMTYPDDGAVSPAPAIYKTEVATSYQGRTNGTSKLPNVYSSVDRINSSRPPTRQNHSARLQSPHPSNSSGGRVKSARNRNPTEANDDTTRLSHVIPVPPNEFPKSPRPSSVASNPADRDENRFDNGQIMLIENAAFERDEESLLNL